ncbi:hypothetical protein GE061_016418 [Apolygus lucorum]|uniref:Uncharacterized protein n=1 Tax=Apolygus lucorum TaxID=248454 RepID=A0A8S9XH90_APOLU|nr:hypothetical protein GE061_016418 [Apolygus lucorum]
MELRNGKVIPGDGDRRTVYSAVLHGGSYTPAHIDSSSVSVASSHDSRVVELEEKLREANLRILSLEDHIEHMSTKSGQSSRASSHSESLQGAHSDQYYVPPGGYTPRQVNASTFVPVIQNVQSSLLVPAPQHVPGLPDALIAQVSSALPATRVPVYASHAPQPLRTPEVTYCPDLREPLPLKNEPLRGNHPYVAKYRGPPAPVQNTDSHQPKQTDSHQDDHAQLTHWHDEDIENLNELVKSKLPEDKSLIAPSHININSKDDEGSHYSSSYTAITCYDPTTSHLEAVVGRSKNLQHKIQVSKLKRDLQIA